MKTYKQPKSLKNAIINLPAPASPLTGRGYSRVSTTKNGVQMIADITGEFVNAGRPGEMQGLHFTTTYSRATGKWGKSTPSYWLSPEMSNLINENKDLIPFVGLSKSQRRRLREEQKRQADHLQIILEQKKRAAEETRIKKEESIQQRYDANKTTVECEITEIFKVFFNNEIHPAPEHVANAKKTSTQSWGTLRKTYHS